jgi:hypothetical protein
VKRKGSLGFVPPHAAQKAAAPAPAPRKKEPRPPADAAPWERQERETLASFEKFAAYRDTLPSKRSHAELARRFGISKSRVHEIALSWKWSDRCRAWDEYRDAVGRDAELAAHAEMSARHARLGRALQAASIQGLAKLAKSQEAKDAEPLRAHEIARLAAVGVKTERLAVGEPTEIPGAPPPASESEEGNSRDVARRILANPKLLDQALDLARALETDPAPDGGAPDAKREGPVQSPPPSAP